LRVKQGNVDIFGMAKGLYRFGALVFVATLILPVAVEGQVLDLYSNSYDFGDYGVYDAGNPTYTVNGQTYQSEMVADSFALNQDSTISTVKIWGPSSFPLSGMTFTVNFYANTNGNPGALLESETVTTTGTIESQPDPGLPGLYIESFLNTGSLSAPVTLPSGSYFFGAWNDNIVAGVSSWTWNASTDGQGNALLLDSASPEYNVLPVDTGSNVEFELDGTAVPEPSTYFLLLSSVTMLFLAKRRKRALPSARAAL
jgi:hypothetical protein